MRIVMLMAVIFSLTAFSQEKVSSETPGDKVEYICPMYCTDDVSQTPATCRVCGMTMADRKIVENPKDYKIIRPQQALDKMKSDPDIVLLDVRSKGEYNDKLGHLENSVLIPIDELDGRVGELEKDKKKTIIAYCSHGIRSARAAKILEKKGFTVFSLVGGLTKWNREKLPVVRE